MKSIFLLLCIAFSFSATGYDRNKAYAYAEKWWNGINTMQYQNANPLGGDCANFVSQCLIAGGFNLEKHNCEGTYGKGGTILLVSSLEKCLKNNGWKMTTSLPSNFKKGDVIIYPNRHAVIAVTDYPKVTYAAHNNDRWKAQIYYEDVTHFYHYPDDGGVPSDGCVKTCVPKRCVEDVANDVILGKYGNGNTRVQKL